MNPNVKNKSLISFENMQAEYKKAVQEAHNALEAAEAAKENADSPEAFEKACDDARHAQERISFFENKLNKVKFTPRMDETEYNKKVNTEIQKVKSAATDFKKVASKAMNELKAAYNTYIGIFKAADKTLEDLDADANILQCKFRYHEQRFQGMPASFTEDPSEWKRHAVRFGSTGKGYDLIAKDGNEWNETMCAAIQAAERIK